MKQDEFLKQVESTPAYRENPQVRAVFETHRAELEGKHGDELLAVHVQIMHELAEVLNAPASNPTPEAPNTDQAVQEFNTTIDAFRSLTVDEKLKIKLIPSTYARALKGAQALSPTEQFPNQSRCLTELKKLTVPEWRDICNLTEEPSLAIEPAKSFEENLQSMNLPKNLVYRDANNQPQVAAYVNPDANSPYKNATKRPKGAVHIVEGKVHPKAPPSGTSAELGKRKEFYQTTWNTGKTSNHAFGHIRPGAMQTLLQGSLIEATEKGDNNLIIDNWESGDGTITFLHQTDLTESPLVACAGFDSDSRLAYFDANDPEDVRDRARGRASVQLFEF